MLAALPTILSHAEQHAKRWADGGDEDNVPEHVSFTMCLLLLIAQTGAKQQELLLNAGARPFLCHAINVQMQVGTVAAILYSCIGALLGPSKDSTQLLRAVSLVRTCTTAAISAAQHMALRCSCWQLLSAMAQMPMHKSMLPSTSMLILVSWCIPGFFAPDGGAQGCNHPSYQCQLDTTKIISPNTASPLTTLQL